MNEITILAQDLLKSWKEGWPEYSVNESDDYSSIVSLAQQIATRKNLHLDVLDDFKAISDSLTRIAFFCKFHDPWYKKNIFWANMCFQNLINHINGVNRIKNRTNEEWKKKVDQFLAIQRKKQQQNI